MRGDMILLFYYLIGDTERMNNTDIHKLLIRMVVYPDGGKYWPDMTVLLCDSSFMAPSLRGHVGVIFLLYGASPLLCYLLFFYGAKFEGGCLPSLTLDRTSTG